MTPTSEEREIDTQDFMQPQVWTLLRRALTPRGVEFFLFYAQLQGIFQGDPAPEDLREQFRNVTNQLIRVRSPIDGRPLSPVLVNRLSEIRSPMNTLLQRLSQGYKEDTTLWVRINQIMVPLLTDIAKDKGVYMRSQQKGAERWAIFRKMTEKQEYVEKLKDEDPESYALIVQKGKTLEDIDVEIHARIEAQGLKVGKSFVMGRPVLTGEDPATKEKRIFDRDGEVLTFPDYVKKRKDQEQQKKLLERTPHRSLAVLEKLRSLTDEEVDSLPGEIEWAALTDDQAKQGRLTRIFSVKNYPQVISEGGQKKTEWVKVIVSGRYKGVLLDHMVNSHGRLIEGTSYGYNEKDGKTTGIPRKIDPATREPYITTARIGVEKQIGFKKWVEEEDRLYLKIPGTRQYSELRNAIKSLACNTGTKRGCVPSITYHKVEGSNAAGFYFQPKDFALIRETLKGLSLSKGALESIKTYYQDLSRAEQATAKENLTYYTAEALGGFKTTFLNRDTGEVKKFDLLTKQKQALAWMDARGNNGLCSPDTGVGKTNIAIAEMQKLLRDGLGEKDASYTTPDGRDISTNGRFLFVSPNSLKGNLPKEIRAFISDPTELFDRLDLIGYSEFSRGAVSHKVPISLKDSPHWKNKPWDIQRYVAIFFDEAQELASLSSSKFKAANSVYHPRKILLTASPMEKEPEQAYLLVSIANNIDLSSGTEEASKNRMEMRRFMERFTERVGGRVVGVKEDPVIKRDLDTWVKANIFYADKTDVEEFELPELRPETLAITMSPAVEEVYRDVTSTMPRLMRGLASKFRDRGLTPDGKMVPEARDPDIERAFTLAFRPVLRTLNSLSNYPREGLLDVATMLETRLTPDGKEVPRSLWRVLKAWGEKFTPDQLREVASTLGNPKLEATSKLVMEKLERTDGSSRSLIFSDDKRLCVMSGMHLSKSVPGWHAVALNDSITIYSGGEPLAEISFDMDPQEVLRTLGGNETEAREMLSRTGGRSRISLPLKKKAYRKYPELPAHKLYNIHYKADRWQQFAMQEIICQNPRIKTCTLQGQIYQFGHNLQAFNNVIHLDRDTFSSENMKQRTARAWRQGQSHPVDETTLDTVFAETPDHSDADSTFDEIRRWFQSTEANVFDRIIKDAQARALGIDWTKLNLRDSSNTKLDRDVIELMASPFVSRSKPPRVR